MLSAPKIKSCTVACYSNRYAERHGLHNIIRQVNTLVTKGQPLSS